MNTLSVNDLNELIRLVDMAQNRTARLDHIRRELVKTAIYVNGGVDE